MSVIKKMRRQTAVYWAPTGLDTYGRPSLAAPVQISCRWDDVAEEFLDKDGNKQVSVAVVYPDRVLLLGGVLWKGLLIALTDGINPFRNPGGAWPVGRFSAIPNFKATETLYIAHLGESKK